MNLYADDTTIYSTDENPVVFGARMEKDLESVANWIKMNGLKMNVVKTQLMVLTRKGKYHTWQTILKLKLEIPAW